MRGPLSVVLLVACGVASLNAIWAPGAWWQWLLTSVVLLIAAAGVAPPSQKPEPHSLFKGSRDE